MVTSSKLLGSTPIVVHVSTDLVEALIPRTGAAAAKGVPNHRLARYSHDVEFGAPLASVIASCLKEEGIKRSPVVLALGADLVKSKTVEVPSLGQKELGHVISRRAAGLIGLEPDEVTYSALALDGEDNAERRWLLNALPRTALVELQTELRKSGYPVRHAVAARTAPFLAGRLFREDTSAEGASIVVLFEPEHCAIGLLSGGRLTHTTALQGGDLAHLEDPQTVRAFIQELRGIDAFWRRSSRGERVTSVVIGGLASVDVTRFQPAIKSALGDSDVKAMEIQGIAGVSPSSTDREVSAFEKDEVVDYPRIDMLSTLLSPRMSALDFSIELRPRGKTLLAVGAVSAVVFGAFAVGLRDDFLAKAGAITTKASVVAAAGSDLGELEQLSATVQDVETMVRTAAQQLQEASSMGLPAERLMEGIFAAFQNDAMLMSVAAVSPTSPSGGQTQIRIGGVVPDAPGYTAQALQRLKSRLAVIEGVESVDVETPRLENGGAMRSTRRNLNFSAVLRLEGGAAEQPTDDSPMPGGMGA